MVAVQLALVADLNLLRAFSVDVVYYQTFTFRATKQLVNLFFGLFIGQKKQSEDITSSFLPIIYVILLAKR